jgi:hypothetical protein
MKKEKLPIIFLFLTLLILPVVYSQNNDNFFYDNRIHQHDWNEDYCECRAMHNSDFMDLKKVLSDRWFESERIEFAKNAIYNNYFTIEQVREILNIMWFESSRLELAKLAYHKTVNNNKYFKLYDVFWFESSVTDLNNYIRTNKY